MIKTNLATFTAEPSNMKRPSKYTRLLRAVLVLAISIAASSPSFGQRVPSPAEIQQAEERAQRQQKLDQITTDKAAYASDIVSRWEDAAKTSGRWDEHFTTDLQGALMKLNPESLLAVGEAANFTDMMTTLATGHPAKTLAPNALMDALGDLADDLVYTPVTPCRIVDTRNAGGPIAANSTRSFSADTSSFTAQGGFAGSCGIPFGVAHAVAMTITATGSVGSGYFTAWAVGQPQPLSSVLNFGPDEAIANTTIVPITPGSGGEFTIYSAVSAQAIVDVVGFFAAPTATALDCTTVSSTQTSVPVDVWTPIDANCPAGRTATGGGYNTPEGTLGYPGVWITSLPNGNGWRVWVDNQTNGNRNIVAYCNCCRVPGR